MTYSKLTSVKGIWMSTLVKIQSNMWSSVPFIDYIHMRLLLSIKGQKGRDWTLGNFVELYTHFLKCALLWSAGVISCTRTTKQPFQRSNQHGRQQDRNCNWAAKIAFHLVILSSKYFRSLILTKSMMDCSLKKKHSFIQSYARLKTASII